MNLTRGLVIAERYELVESLGHGSMGAIWCAKHTLTNKNVALKFLKEATDPVLMRRFVREARATSSVRHPNVVDVYDILSLGNGLMAMVMELLEGETLAKRLERSGALPIQELARILARVVSAVRAVHKAGIVHRDIKPENIFLARRGDGTIEPMLLDFGICKLRPEHLVIGERSELTGDGQVIGTPSYMAPEQVLAAKDVGAQADVWALGVILYECATGQRPIDAESLPLLVRAIISAPIVPIEQLAPHVPTELASLVKRMLLRNRSQRLSDLREAVSVLRSLLDPHTDDYRSAPPSSMLPRRSPVRLATTVASKGSAAAARVGGAKPVRRWTLSQGVLVIATLAAAFGVAWRSYSPPKAPSQARGTALAPPFVLSRAAAPVPTPRPILAEALDDNRAVTPLPPAARANVGMTKQVGSTARPSTKAKATLPKLALEDFGGRR
jgi:serine/threonine-protein kinase